MVLSGARRGLASVALALERRFQHRVTSRAAADTAVSIRGIALRHGSAVLVVAHRHRVRRGRISAHREDRAPRAVLDRARRTARMLRAIVGRKLRCLQQVPADGLLTLDVCGVLDQCTTFRNRTIDLRRIARMDCSHFADYRDSRTFAGLPWRKVAPMSWTRWIAPSSARGVDCESALASPRFAVPLAHFSIGSAVTHERGRLRVGRLRERIQTVLEGRASADAERSDSRAVHACAVRPDRGDGLGTTRCSFAVGRAASAIIGPNGSGK